jgi:hypothetical protein
LIKKGYHAARSWVVERTYSWHNGTGVFSLMYYCLQEDNFRIGSKATLPVKLLICDN